MSKSLKQKMNFYSFNLNKYKGGRMSLKKLLIIFAGLTLVGALSHVYAQS